MSKDKGGDWVVSPEKCRALLGLQAAVFHLLLLTVSLTLNQRGKLPFGPPLFSIPADNGELKISEHGLSWQVANNNGLLADDRSGDGMCDPLLGERNGAAAVLVGLRV